MTSIPSAARYLADADHARLVAALAATTDRETVALILGERANVWSDTILSDPQALPACICQAAG